MQRRVTLRLSLACNNRCVFCAQHGLADDGGAGATSLAARLERLRGESDEITFVGGEPTLDRLPEAVAAAAALGFRRIGVQSNGRRLAVDGLAAALAGRGLTDVQLSLHAAAPAGHDYHTGIAGSFAQSLLGLAAARAAGLTVVVATVLTRSNFRSLGALPWLLRGRGVAAWLVEVPVAAGRAAAGAGFDRVLPRLALAVPFALHALAAAGRLGLPAFIRGAPLCTLGPHAARALPGEPRAFAPACAHCPARPRCPGADAAYLDRFGGDELDSRRLADAAALLPAPAEAGALAPLFVGIGAQAAAAPAASEPRARVTLPVLGKVAPARGEVAASAPRRSGAELRALFPQLFDGEG